mgnify:CR=1 FL=1
MSIDLNLTKKEEELLQKQEKHLEELKLFNETLKNCKCDSSFIDEFLEKYEEELKDFRNLPIEEKFRLLTERNSEKAE